MGHRRQLGDAARQRALLHFTTDRVVRVYGALYTDLAPPPLATAFELALAVPAPRSPSPVTLRWLAPEGGRRARHAAGAPAPVQDGPIPGGPMPGGSDDPLVPMPPASHISDPAPIALDVFPPRPGLPTPPPEEPREPEEFAEPREALAGASPSWPMSRQGGDEL